MRVQSVRDSEREMREILTECQNQDLHVKLVTPYYDASRDVVRFATDEDGDSNTETEYDYLSAYLPHTMSDAPLSKSNALSLKPRTKFSTRDQALLVREKCLRSLKERLIERANVMQMRYDEETRSLNKLMVNYNRDKDQMTIEQVHEHEQQCTSTRFR